MVDAELFPVNNICLGWAVPKALHGYAHLFDQKRWFPTKFGSTKNLRLSQFYFADS